MKTIGLIELQSLKLVDQDGLNYTALRSREPLVSKQILIPQIKSGNFNVTLVNLKDGRTEKEFGEINWTGKRLTKISVGQNILDLKPDMFDIWGITANYMQERELACLIIKYLSDSGVPVVVGGSDAAITPHYYLSAGAKAVIRDKSGAANLSVLAYLTDQKLPERLTGVILNGKGEYKKRIPLMSPENWPLPDLETSRNCLGMEYWECSLPSELLPIGSVMTDIGCDQQCNFCQTPLYGLGYKYMSPERILQWINLQKSAGAKSVVLPADQFLGRTNKKQGREEILQIMQEIRQSCLVILWGNGLELKKTTLGKGRPNSDLTPDEQLINALWGWNGKVGCYHAYIPAERPTKPKSYKKLIPWQQHCQLIESIVRSGVPDLTYGVIIGLPDDDSNGLCYLEEAIISLKDKLMTINPELKFRITPYAIRPLPSTPQEQLLKKNGLIRFEDPIILGGFWTACADTYYMSYEEISKWQIRLIRLGYMEDYWQGLSGIIKSAGG
ncbi:MAG: radical SAM protein [Flavobacterium sp.]|nr:radical SAM protein [Flavobacterium sp.]